MDHDEALDIIETAAAEPGGLDRLMAGDTADASRLAGHLAECEACTEQLRRIGRTADFLRAAVRDRPSPELRQRTLDYVRAVGRPRAAELAADGPAVAAMDAVPVLVPAGSASPASVDARAGSAPVSMSGIGGRAGNAERTGARGGVAARRWPSGLGLAASLAGSALLAAAVAFAVVGIDRGAAEQRYEDTITALAKVNVWTLRVDGQPDASRVVLTAADGSPASATLVFSPATTELVVVATDLAEPPAGQEYRCWLEVNGQRTRVGKMFFGGGLAYWVGPVEATAQAADGTRFGISLAPIDSPSIDAAPVMSGTL